MPSHEVGGCTQECNAYDFVLAPTIELLPENVATPTPSPTISPSPTRTPCQPECSIISPVHLSGGNPLTVTIKHGGRANSFTGLRELSGPAHSVTKIDAYTYLAQDLRPNTVYGWGFQQDDPCSDGVTNCYSSFGTLELTPTPTPTDTPTTSTLTPTPTVAVTATPTTSSLTPSPSPDWDANGWVVSQLP